MLIRSAHLRGIAVGEISLAFRRWRAPTVKAGGTLRTAIGVLAIEAVDVVREGQISESDAAAAGYRSREELLAFLREREDGSIHRIRLRLAGPDPREALRERAELTAEELAQVLAKLDRLDARGTQGPWTLRVLRAIEENPGLLAARLAGRLGLETAWLKPHVRKLKELGLTESLEVGYRLSPRGRAVLAAR